MALNLNKMLKKPSGAEAMSDYAQMIKEAEQAVAPVKDPELKRIAFEKILDSLLEKPHRDSLARRAAPRQAAKRAKEAGGKEKRKRGGPQGYIEEMIGEKFFAKPKTLGEVKAELGNRGHHIPLTHLSGPMQRLCQRKHLRRQKTADGKKQIFTYSNW